LLRFSGTSANTYLGSTTVNEGKLTLSKTAGLNAVPGALIVGDGAGAESVQLLADNQIANGSAVTIKSSGQLDLNSFSDTIGPLTMTGGVVATVDTGAGVLTLNGNVATIASASSAVIDGNLNLGGATRTFTIANGDAGDNLFLSADLVVSAAISNGALTKAGAGALSLQGDNA
jgi:autotransporter-associated beta strand protein